MVKKETNRCEEWGDSGGVARRWCVRAVACARRVRNSVYVGGAVLVRGECGTVCMRAARQGASAGQCGAVCGRELLYGRRDLWALVLGLEKL